MSNDVKNIMKRVLTAEQQEVLVARGVSQKCANSRFSWAQAAAGKTLIRVPGHPYPAGPSWAWASEYIVGQKI